jgi:hypothetical protein
LCLAGCSGSSGGAGGSGKTLRANAGGDVTKSSSGAATSAGSGAGNACRLPGAAFCDAFTEKSPGGRAGDLDDAKWSFSRLGFGCADCFAFPATPVNFCGRWNTVNPGGPDSAFCVTENDDPRWTEGFHDNTSFNYLQVRIRQPFDFANRMGTVTWQADARTAGGHGWWIETWITEDPVPGVLLHDDQLVTSRNAIGVVMALNCGRPTAGTGTNGAGLTGIDRIIVVKNYRYQDVYDPFTGSQANSRCVKTEQGELNTFHFRLSQKRIEVLGSHVGQTELIPLAEANIALPFSRGYVNITHVHYNADKADVPSYQSYQWARVAFDGPVLSTPRAYGLPDSLSRIQARDTCGTESVFRISYGVTDRKVHDLGKSPESPLSLAFENVDLTDAVGARLNFNTTYVSEGDVLSFRFNGKTWRDYTVPAINTTWERQGFSIPVPLGDLVSGSNGVAFGTNSKIRRNSMHIANIDLEVVLP